MKTTIEITDELQLEATRALIRAYGANIAAVDMHSATLIILRTALPIIEKQVREQCAAEIEVHMRRHDHSQVGFSAVGDAYAHAARIVQEGK